MKNADSRCDFRDRCWLVERDVERPLRRRAFAKTVLQRAANQLPKCDDGHVLPWDLDDLGGVATLFLSVAVDGIDHCGVTRLGAFGHLGCHVRFGLSVEQRKALLYALACSIKKSLGTFSQAAAAALFQSVKASSVLFSQGTSTSSKSLL
jgi:hypothetical protein